MEKKGDERREKGAWQQWEACDMHAVKKQACCTPAVQ